MPATSRRSPLTLLAAPAVAAIVVTGGLVAGGVISDDFRASMALTAAWLAISGAACVRVARRRRGLRISVMAAYYLTLTSFSTSPGPDLRVRLVPSGCFDGGADKAVDLGALKGKRGNQQYTIPRDIDLNDRVAVVWCRAFSAAFGSAQLRQTQRSSR